MIFKIFKFINNTYIYYQTTKIRIFSQMLKIDKNIDKIDKFWNFQNVQLLKSKYTIIKSKMYKYQFEIYENY